MNIEMKRLEIGSPGDSLSNPALELAAGLTGALGKAKALPLRPQDAALLEGLETFRFGVNNCRVAWSAGSGPLVILVHGYSGRGVQMAALARTLAAKGFRCVFFDAGGHGASETEKIGFSTFMTDTRDIIAHLGEPVHALIGHSAGALAFMRARALFGIRAQKYAVISAPLFPYVPLATMRGKGAPEQSLDYVKAVLSDQFQMSWASLVKGESFVWEDGKEMLAIYDTEDPRVRHTDADEIGRLWPGTKITKTIGYGHNRILKAPEVLEAVANFVKR